MEPQQPQLLPSSQPSLAKHKAKDLRPLPPTSVPAGLPWQGQGTHGNHCTSLGSPHHKRICLEVRQLPGVRQNISQGGLSASQDLWGKKRSLRFGFETRHDFSEVLWVQLLCFILGKHWEISSSKNSHYLSGILKGDELQAVSEVPK